jgi:hypothetical protein
VKSDEKNSSKAVNSGKTKLLLAIQFGVILHRQSKRPSLFSLKFSADFKIILNSLGMVPHAYNSSTHQARTGGS